MPEQASAIDEERYIVEVIGELPYYVPMPQGATLAPNSIGAQPFQLYFQHFQPLRHPDDSQGEGVDDRLGTYIKSRVHICFRASRIPSEAEKDAYEEKALNLTNKALTSMKYAVLDHTITHVNKFQRTSTHVWEIAADGKAMPAGTFAEKTSYSPFGIGPQRTLTEAALNRVWWIFNDLEPMNPAFLLILDARYHNVVHDLPRAILDVATALEINIDSLVNHYSLRDRTLSQIDLEHKGIYQLYDEVFPQATGRSLHEKPDLYVEMEYIREIRNSIAHEWKPEFHVSEGLRKKSKYLAQHQPRDGHVVETTQEVDSLIASGMEIIRFCIEAFKTKYGNL
jgi:hypothetical protein